jgi:hypothetical protein
MPPPFMDSRAATDVISDIHRYMASEFLSRLVMELALVNLKIRSMIYINETLHKMTVPSNE